MVRNDSPPQLLVEEFRLSEVKSNGFQYKFYQYFLLTRRILWRLLSAKEELLNICVSSIYLSIYSFIHMLSKNSTYVGLNIMISF